MVAFIEFAFWCWVILAVVNVLGWLSDFIHHMRTFEPPTNTWVDFPETEAERAERVPAERLR